MSLCIYTVSQWVDPSQWVTLQAFKRDEILCFLDHATLAPTRIWSTVQWGPRQEDNLELNSDLVYSQSALLNTTPRPFRIPAGSH
jgi:hypothetical protein